MYRIYTWFDVTTTLCYPCYLSKYVYLHISSPHSFLNTPLSMLHTSKTLGGPPKKKINLQSTHSTRLSSFHLGTHHSSTYRKSSGQIIPRFKNYYIPQQPPKPQQQPSCSTHCAEPTSNIPFTGWIGQRHENTMSDSCPPKLDGEMPPSRSGI